MYTSFNDRIRVKSFEELSSMVNSVKPFKVVQKGRGWVGGQIGWEADITEGTDLQDIAMLVREIEKNELLSAEQKFMLERTISNNVNKYGGYEYINRGALNVLLMIKNNVEGFTRGYRLSSVKGLEKHALVFSHQIKSKKITVVEGVKNILGASAEETREERIVYTSVLSLTEFGKRELYQLERQAKRVVYKDISNLRKLGEI